MSWARHRAAALASSLALSLSPAMAPPEATAAVHADASPDEAGYWLAAENGSVAAFGAARPLGPGVAGLPGGSVVGMTPTASADGFWLFRADGTTVAFGDARPLGSLAARNLNQPVVGMAASPSGNGYWMVASDGGIFAFGDARFFGSMGGKPLNRPIVAMAVTPSGSGYWLLGSDGGIFAFGDAVFHGSMGATVLNRPVVGMAPTPSGDGYWFVGSDGGIFAFGDAPFRGSTGSLPLNQPVRGMGATPTGRGYTLVASDGGVFTFGDAVFRGSLAGPPGRRVVAIAVAGSPRSGPITEPASGPADLAVGPTPQVPPSTAPSPDIQPAEPPRPFDIAVLGDIGFSDDDTEERVRNDINRSGVAMTLHNGDIWRQGTPCTDDRYLTVRDEFFNQFSQPVFYTPGDNEWEDCSDDRAGRLQHIRRTFFSTDESLGQSRSSVVRQGPTYVENARWRRDGVVFATLDVPGPDGAGVGSTERRRANLAWLNGTFDDAVANHVPAVVIVWQDNPFEPNGGELIRTLKARAAAYGGPVVLVHGDTHELTVDRPWPDVPNVTRVETDGPGSTRWVRIKIDPSAPAVFAFEVERAR